MGDHGLGQEKRALEVDGQEAVEIGLVHLQEGARLEQAGIVDEHIDATEAGQRRVDETLAVGRVADIGDERQNRLR